MLKIILRKKRSSNREYKTIMGIGNIGNMMKIMNAWNTFKQNHPKFPAFCSAVSRRRIREGSILEVTYISPEGEKLTTNIKVQQSDIELLRELSGSHPF